MTNLRRDILTRLAMGGECIPPQLWLNVKQNARPKMLEELHTLVREGLVLRTDKGESSQWYFYSITEAGLTALKPKRRKS